ncbi:uncharacterized protein J3R85_011970 [Psidium guajava]|nr:uncharacterized protein J3R85_011970 [Psidium guajava]
MGKKEGVPASPLLFLRSQAHRVAESPPSTTPAAAIRVWKLTRRREQSICREPKRRASRKEVERDEGEGVADADGHVDAITSLRERAPSPSPPTLPPSTPHASASATYLKSRNRLFGPRDRHCGSSFDATVEVQ